MTFNGRTDRVVVFPSETLSSLRGLRASATIRVDELAQRSTIIEGYLAFSLHVEADGTLAAGVYTGFDWAGLQSSPAAVRPGTWTDLAFLYDGRDTSALSVNGVIVASLYAPLGQVASVEWPYGLNVGAWPDADVRLFKGEIADVKLWRLSRQ